MNETLGVKMTDCELLTLAAKAMGMRVNFHPTPSYFWNPLTDDGYALLLAVTLGIHITNSSTDAWASHLSVTATEPLGKDPYAATRRAIVRVAAEIGRKMS